MIIVRVNNDFFLHYYFFSSYLWVSLSSMYGKVLVMLMLAFCLTEVMDNKIRPLAFQVRKRNCFQLTNYSSIYYILVFIDISYLLFFQGIFMMYLYVGSIVAIMCIYISVLLDQCPSLTGRCVCLFL